MTPEELYKFKKEVAAPAMKRLLDKAALSEGSCFIDNIELSYLDGRSWGADYVFKASGFTYKNGRVEEYCNEVCNVVLQEFVDSLKSCTLILDGTASVYDELREMEIKIKLRTLNELCPLFPEFELFRSLNYGNRELEYLKMRSLFANQVEQDSLNNVDEIINSAAERSSTTPCTQESEAYVK